VDSSLRRFELIANPAFRRRYRLQLQGRPFTWSEDPDQPLAVRFRQEALFPCLHPCLPVDVPLQLDVLAADSGEPVARWQLRDESSGFELLTESSDPTGMPRSQAHPPRTPLSGAGEHCSTVDLRL
jgi:hypothetical protein